MEQRTQSSRFAGLDILRIVVALNIFMGHSIAMFGCSYGILQPLSDLREFSLKVFFMLSGFALFHGYGGRDLSGAKERKNFYIKRAAAILPLYYAVAVIHIIFIGNVETAADVVKLLPIQILGLQSAFHTLFSVSHHGGTWFVSCLLLSYLFYPFLQELIKSLSYRKRIGLAVLLAALSIYSNYVVAWFSLSSNYSDPFFRGLEFCLGAALASVKKDECKHVYCAWGGVATILLVIALYSNLYVGIFPLHSLLNLPTVSGLILGLSSIRLRENPAVRYLSAITYGFYLAQLFVWNVTLPLLEKLNLTESNGCRILISLLVCTGMAIAFHECIEQPVKRWMRRGERH